MADLTLPEASHWNQYWGLEGKKFTSVSWSKRRILKILQPFLTRGKKVLDAGCGSGFFSKYFCDQGLQTVSIDYADKALEMTRQVTEGRSLVIKVDLLKSEEVKKIGADFDLIFTDGLLEHFTASEQD